MVAKKKNSNVTLRKATAVIKIDLREIVETALDEAFPDMLCEDLTIDWDQCPDDWTIDECYIAINVGHMEEA